MKKKLTLVERLRLAQTQRERLIRLLNESKHRCDCLPRDLRRALEEVQRLEKLRDRLPNQIRDLVNQLEGFDDYIAKLDRRLKLKRDIAQITMQIEHLSIKA